MEILMKISAEAEAELLESAKDQVRDELIGEALKDYLKAFPYLSIIEALRDLGINIRYEALKEKQVRDLCRDDKMIMMLHWIMYDKLV